MSQKVQMVANKQNTRENQYIIRKTHTQTRPKVNVYPTILRDIIVPCYIVRSLTTINYFELLHLLKLESAFKEIRIICQYKEAHAHSYCKQ